MLGLQVCRRWRNVGVPEPFGHGAALLFGGRGNDARRGVFPHPPEGPAPTPFSAWPLSPEGRPLGSRIGRALPVPGRLVGARLGRTPIPSQRPRHPSCRLARRPLRRPPAATGRTPEKCRSPGPRVASTARPRSSTDVAQHRVGNRRLNGGQRAGPSRDSDSAVGGGARLAPDLLLCSRASSELSCGPRRWQGERPCPAASTCSLSPCRPHTSAVLLGL